MMMRSCVAMGLAVAWSLCLGGSAATADFLDNFEFGGFGPLVDTTVNGSGVSGTQSGLPTDSVLGGERLANAFLWAGGGSISLELDTSGDGDHSATFTAGVGSRGWGVFNYSNFAPTDLTAGGNDRFIVELSEDPGLGLIALGFQQGNGFFNQNIFLNGSGTYEILFADFGGQPTAAALVKLEMNSAPNPGPYTISVSDVRIVPEPATLGLLALGALSMARVRRSRHRA